MPLTPSRVSEADRRRHEELFRKNHILGTKDLNTIFTMSRTDALKIDFNNSTASANSSFTSEGHLTPLRAEDVENDPRTPFLREEYRKRATSSEDFSPVPTAAKKLIDFNTTPNKSGSGASKTSLLRASMTNRLITSNPSASSSSSDLAELVAQTPSQVNLPKGPSSILKKARNINYDRETSQKLLEKRPDLSTALNEAGELNPLKAAKKVVMSPRKETIPPWNNLPKGTRFSSPLTDSIEGKSRVSVKSPYTRPKKSSKSQSKTDKEWVDDEEDTSEKTEKSSKRSSKRRKEKDGNVKRFLGSLVDPQLPYILSLYLQLLFNVVIVSILLYFVYTFISTVRADVENKVDSYATDIIQEIALCSREYARNNCQPGRRVVALEAACSEWERCMNRDPTTVGRAKIGAETFAEIINGFIKPISWKSMFFLLLITVGSLVLTNAAFGTYRNYSGNHDPYHSQQQQQQQVPQTPAIPQTPHQSPYKSLQMNAQYTRYYTPGTAQTPTSVALVRSSRMRSARKSKK